MPTQFRSVLFFCLLGCLTIAHAENQSPIIVESLDAEVPVVTETPQERILEEVASRPRSGSEIQYQMQILQEEVMTLRGLVEQLSYEIQRHRGIQDDRYLELDRRLQNLGTAPVAVSTEQSIDSAPPADGDLAVQDQSEQTLYDSGLASIKARQFEDAIDQLRQLIEQYPDGDFTANAYYWIGEVHAAMPQPDYEQARQALVQVIDGFPDSNKVPDASFKLGKVYHLMGDCSRAKAFLQQVATGYATKSAGQLAERYLTNQIDC